MAAVVDGMGSNTSIHYPYLMEMETTFSIDPVHKWMADNWIPVCTTASALYLVFIFTVQEWMRDRPAYNLRLPLAAWSLSLALFSMAGAARAWPEFLTRITQDGLHHTVCNDSFLTSDSVSSMWTALFVISKLPELGDTVFIVLRKQKLIFLHWYHHVTVLLFSWYSYAELAATCRWFVVMNYSVHALMYSYYAVRASRVKVPKPLAMVITLLQLLQMVVGCWVNILAWRYKAAGRDCSVSQTNLYWSFAMYFSYFILFARFFQQAYFSRKTAQKTLKSE